MPLLYAAFESAFLVVAGQGEDWTVTVEPVDVRPECVAASPDEPDRVLRGTFGAGLHRSSDGGRSWVRVGEGTVGENVMSLAVSPHDPDTIWAGTEPSAVYRSTDGGDTWAERPGLTDLPSAGEWYFPPRPSTHHVRWIEVDPNDAERLYVGIEAGAFVLSPDAGGTWRERPEGARLDNHSLATHPDAPGQVYAAAGDGYAESTDGGEHWSHPQDGLDHRYVWSVAVDRGDPDTVLASSASGARTAHSADAAESYVYRRRGDAPWEVCMDGLPKPGRILRSELAAGDAGEFYAVNNRGVFRSTDAGSSWKPLGVEWPEAFEDETCRGLAVVGGGA